MTTRIERPLRTETKYPQSESILSPYPPENLEELDMRETYHVSRAIHVLGAHYEPWGNVFVRGMDYLCWNTRTHRTTWLSPDVLVAFDIDLEASIWWNGFVIDEVGRPPEFVLEVASEHTGVRDYTVKREGYARYGVPEYWRFDWTGGNFHDQPLAGDRLVNGEYEPIPLTTEQDGMIWGRSEVLGLDLCWDDGNLRFYDPSAGRYLPDLSEALDERDTERAGRVAAEIERDTERAERISAEIERDTERTERISAETRAAEAEAELRRLREQLRLAQSE